MGKELITSKMGISILETGLKIVKTAMEYYNTQVEQSMMVNGWTTEPQTRVK
jgi:hypothetical protein